MVPKLRKQARLNSTGNFYVNADEDELQIKNTTYMESVNEGSGDVNDVSLSESLRKAFFRLVSLIHRFSQV